MKFRKKPVVIEAMEFTGSPRVATQIIDWALASDGTIRYHSGPRECLSINTLEGTMTADVGDWIIRGVQGEFYPCKPDIFEATYEPVTPPTCPACHHSTDAHGITDVCAVDDCECAGGGL